MAEAKAEELAAEQRNSWTLFDESIEKHGGLLGGGGQGEVHKVQPSCPCLSADHKHREESGN
jgi:hypothetical protein